MSSLNGRQIMAVTTQTADATLTSTDHGMVHKNTAGTTGVVTLTLPAASVGLWFDFLCDSTVQFIIKPAGTDSIGLPTTGAQGTSGLSITALVRGNAVRLACLVAGDWHVLSSVGTTGWTTT